MWMSAGVQTHPLHQYSYAKRLPVQAHDLHKCIVDPDFVYSYFVHDGLLLPGGSFKVRKPPSCLL